MLGKIGIEDKTLEEYESYKSEEVDYYDLISLEVDDSYYLGKVVDIEDNLYCMAKLVKGVEEYRIIGTDFGTVNISKLFTDSEKEGKVAVYQLEDNALYKTKLDYQRYIKEVKVGKYKFQ